MLLPPKSIAWMQLGGTLFRQRDSVRFADHPMKLTGTASFATFETESAAAAFVARELSNNGVHGNNVHVGLVGYWINPRAITVNVSPAPGQGVADVENVVSQAFMNMASVFPDTIWDVSRFQAQDTAGMSVANNNPDHSDYVYNAGPLASVDVHIGKPKVTNKPPPQTTVPNYGQNSAGNAPLGLNARMGSLPIEVMFGVGIVLLLLLRRD